MSSWIDSIPLWAFFPITVVVVVVAIEIGFRLGRFRRQRNPDEKEATVGAMSAAALGLLAFFLGFTFSFAGGRFDERRHAMIDEINAIGTCHLRAGTLPPDIRREADSLLRDYVDARIKAVDLSTVQPAIQRSEQIHRQLWALAIKATQSDRSAVTALFISSLNDVIDLHLKRVTYALRSRIPGVIWQALLLVTLLSMGMLGYLEGVSRSSRSPAAIAVVLTFSTMIALIADLDRPGEGSLRLSPQLMIDLGRQLHSETDTP